MSASELPFPAGSSPFKVRGLGYRGAIRRLDERFGRDALVEGMNTPELRQFFLQPFLAATLYDVLPMVPFGERGAELMDQSVDQFLRESASAQAEEDATGVYRAILSLISTESILRAIVKITTRYFNFGDVWADEIEGTSAQLSRSGLPLYVADWYVSVTEGYTVRLLELTGARSVQGSCSYKPMGSSHGVPTALVQLKVSWR